MGTGKHDLTMKPNVELGRRKVLGTVGGLALAGSGLAAFTGSAAAQVNTSFTANNAGTVTTPDGSVRKVMVDTSGTISWKGFDNAAENATVTLEAKKTGVGKANYTELASAEYGVNGLSGEREFALDTVDLTEHFDDSHFESDQDGKKNATGIDLRVSVTITTNGGDPHDASAADTMWVTADNTASDANIEGESDASASTYDQKFVSHDGQNELLVTHGSETYTFVLDVSAWKDASADGFNDGVDNWNLAINLNASESDRANFQVMRKSDGSVKVKMADDSGWGSVSSVSNVGYIEASATDAGTLTVEIPASEFADTYTVMGQATAGGEYSATRISNTEGKAFNGPAWDASDEYYLTVDASE